MRRSKGKTVVKKVGTRGPQATPTAILERRGSKVATYDRKNEPRPVAVLLSEAPPAPPELITKAATKFWERHIRQLCKLGIYTSLDREGLIAYCNAWADYIEAAENVKKFGSVSMNPATGFESVSPWVKVRAEAHTRWMQLSREFGGTPAARARITIEVEGGKEENNKAKFFERAASKQ